MQDVRRLAFAPADRQRDVPLEVLERTAVLSRFPDSWFIRPERLTFHLIMVLGNQDGRHDLDLYPRALPAHSVTVLTPGHVHRFIPSAKFPATLLLVPASTAHLTRFAALRRPGGAPLLLQTGARDRVALPQLLEHLRDEASSNAHRDVLLTTLDALVARLQRLSQEQGHDLDVSTRLGQFLALVDEHHAGHRDVQYYARTLGCSAHTLTRLCREALGDGAKRVIDKRLVLEAKRLLVGTDLAVETVSQRLGFDEATNFIRFFRRIAGCTPTEFRSQTRRSREI